MESREPMTVPYPDFVADLFVKPADKAGRIAHAAVGMVGEAIELTYAVDRQELLEELGDFNFYRQALLMQFPEYTTATLAGPTTFPSTIPGCLSTLTRQSNDLMDLGKKAWIYEKPIDLVYTHTILQHVRNVNHAFAVLCDLLGVSHQEVEKGNRLKLLKRYEGGKYSDAAAQARADKQTQGA